MPRGKVSSVLWALGAQVLVAGRKVFNWEDTLEDFERKLKQGAKAAVFTHVSNVFGYILPVEELAWLCRKYGVSFVVDGAQSAGSLPVSLEKWGADFIAMPGHKGLLGPQGTGLLLCRGVPEPLLMGGTGSESVRQDMPDFTPDRAEAGTVNVPGICGLEAGLRYLETEGISKILQREQRQLQYAAQGLEALGMKVFRGEHQAGTLSFLPGCDCEEAAAILGKQGIAAREGLHCAPLAHESAGTLDSGTVRVSFGHDAADSQVRALLKACAKLPGR